MTIPYDPQHSNENQALSATRLKVALIQCTSGPDVRENMVRLGTLIRDAAAAGAQFIVTPENSCHMRRTLQDKVESSYPVAGHPVVAFYRALADELQIDLLLGSIAVRQDNNKVSNRAYLFNANDADPVEYDKIHLFDADFENGRSYQESAYSEHGDRAVLTDVQGVKTGLTICYDLRFPHLYRALAQGGAEMIVVPAAYAIETGYAHWHTLLRARAIENGVYILAPAQVGTHEGGRQSYGHSLVVNPWGEIVAEIEDDTPGFLMVDLDFAAVHKARKAILSLQHDRPFAVAYYPQQSNAGEIEGHKIALVGAQL